MGVVLNVIWSLLALIIAAVVCYLIYDEYIVNKPEESEAEREIEADLMSMEAEAGVSGYESLSDSRHAGSAPAIEADGAAIIGENGDTGTAAGSDDAPVDEEETTESVSAETVVAAAAADVVVKATADEEMADEEMADEVAADVVAGEAAEEEVEEAAATMNAVVVEDPVDEEVVVDEEVAADEAEVVAERTVEVPVEVDDLTKIKGIGKVYAKRLNAAGITSYQQIIDTDVATLEEVSKAIPAANAYDWARQARKLSDA